MEISEEELQKKLDDARTEAITEATKYEQWRTAFAQGVRLTLPYLESMADQYDGNHQLVKKGVVDAFVVIVFQTECSKILKEYYPTETTEKKV